MNYGLYLSASGVLTSLYRQDVFANNLANVHTAGFKPDVATVAQRPPEAIEGGFGMALRKHMLDKLGGGVLAGPQRIDLRAGAAVPTGNPLDVALGDDRSFLAVGRLDPATGQRQVLLTRDGRLSLDGLGRLVTAAGGHAVLDQADQPIQLEPGLPVTIGRDGQIFQNGAAVARMQVAQVTDPRSLVKQGQGLFDVDPAARTPAQDVNLNVGHTEASGVDPILELNRLVSATKAATANANMLRYHDLLMDRAVNTLGRVG